MLGPNEQQPPQGPLTCTFNDLLGADDGIRTRDPNLGKVVLYQLSHVRVRVITIQANWRQTPPAPGSFSDWPERVSTRLPDCILSRHRRRSTGTGRLPCSGGCADDEGGWRCWLPLVFSLRDGRWHLQAYLVDGFRRTCCRSFLLGADSPDPRDRRPGKLAARGVLVRRNRQGSLKIRVIVRGSPPRSTTALKLVSTIRWNNNKTSTFTATTSMNLERVSTDLIKGKWRWVSS